MRVAIASAGSTFAIAVGEVDNFNVDVEGWKTGMSGGVGSVVRVAAGGPAGASDAFLKVTADPASTIFKLVFFNQAQWAGNYISAGVTSIAMSLKNLGNAPLAMRVTLGTSVAPLNGGEWYTSTNPINLPAMSNWTNVSFPIGAGDLTNFSGMGTYATDMANIMTLRILNVADASPYGDNVDEIPFILGLDNITAVGAAAPIPGDFNNSNKVNAADLTKWRGDFGVNSGSNADGDSDSDGNDFLIWQQHLGEGSGSSIVGAAGAVPEPSSMALAALAVLAGVRCRSRTRGRS